MEFFKDNNRDALLHALAAAVFVALSAFPIVAAVLVVSYFAVREVYQDYKKGYRFPNIWPFRRSTAKDKEALFPAVSSLVVMIVKLVFGV